MPLAAINQGLLDLDQKSEPVPGVAAAWEASPDLLSYTFQLRHGVLFHNGREVDAEAVKWNFERMQDPKIAPPVTRSALENLKATEVLDKYTRALPLASTQRCLSGGCGVLPMRADGTRQRRAG